MKDEDVEEMLRSMPLRQATNLPKRLPTSASRSRRLGRAALAAVCFRIPLWAAAVAVALAVVCTGARSWFPAAEQKPRYVRPARGEAPLEEPRRLSPPVGRVSAGEDFWTLPERYQRMLAAARKQ